MEPVRLKPLVKLYLYLLLKKIYNKERCVLLNHVEQSISNWQTIAAVVIFLLSYAIIISEKINRSVVALTGALLMIIFGIVDFHVAYTEYIHWETIFLLLGMMLLVGITERSGIFQYIAVHTAQMAHGNPVKILMRLALLTACGSAFIDNVTTVLLICPITISIAKILHMSPIPLLISEILICNIGGAATLIGDPPNIMIGAKAGISFNDFLIHITPVILIILLVTALYLKAYYKKHLYVDPQYKEALMEIDAKSYIRDSALVKKSGIAFALTLLGFFMHPILHLEPAMVAMSGATLLMLLDANKNQDIEAVFHSVEWITIFFFAGLFILVGGLMEVGIIKQLATWMIEVTEGNVGVTSITILWGAGIASSFVDNIPLVATMIPMVEDMIRQLSLSATEASTLWWSLALGACLGGNGTLIASSANLVVAGIAAREGHGISFTKFLKVSIPVTLISLVIATAYVYFVFIKIGFA